MMSQSEAIQIIYGDKPDCSHDEIAAAWQKVVDNGTIWRMEKRLVDMACCLIASGIVERNAA
jgi:hypothetical protein